MSSQNSRFARVSLALSFIVTGCSSGGRGAQAVGAAGMSAGGSPPASAATPVAGTASGSTGTSAAGTSEGVAGSSSRGGSAGAAGSAGAGGAMSGAGGSSPSTGSEQTDDAGAEPGTDAGSGGAGGSTEPASPPPANTWPMMGHDIKNWYYNPAETSLSPSNAAQLVEKWRFRISGMPTGSPAIAEGKVFATATEGLYAIDLATGRRIWSRTDIGTTSSVAYEDGAIYVMNQTPPQLYKLKAADGTTVWGPSVAYDAQNSDGESSPILAAGKVIVGHASTPRELSLNRDDPAGARGGVEAFDAATGQKAWTYYTVPEVKTGTENGASVWSSVSIDIETSTVYATSGNNFTVAGPNGNAFHAFDLSSGERRWVSQVLAGDLFCLICGGDLATQDMDFGANPILVDVDGRELVAAGNKTSTFYAMDRKTGQKVWVRDKLSASHTGVFGGIFINGSFDGKHFYVVANDANTETANVYKLDPSSGADVWMQKLNGVTWGASSLANGLLLVPSNTTLYVMGTDKGDVLNKFETGGTIAGGAAAIADGRIVVKSGLVYVGNVTSNDEIICYGLP